MKRRAYLVIVLVFALTLMLANAMDILPDMSIMHPCPCMTKLVPEVYPPQHSIHFITYATDTLNFLPEVQNPVILTANHDLYKPTLIGDHNHNYIFYTKNQTDLDRTLNDFINSTIWDQRNGPRGAYLIVITEEYDKSAIFRFLWKYNVARVILVSIMTNEDLPTLYTWMPYATENRCGTEFNIKAYRNCSHKQAWAEFNQPIKSMVGCTINMIANVGINKPEKVYETPLQSFVLQTLISLGKKLNAEVIYHKVDDLDAEINNNRSDVILVSPTYMRFATVYKNFDYSDIMYRDRVYWLVPTPKHKSKVLFLTAVFGDVVWGSILISFICTTVIWYIVGRFEYDNKFYTSYLNCFFTVFAMNFVIPIKTSPTTFTIRLIMCFYLFFAFHLNYAFQGRMGGMLLKPDFEDPIATPEELLNSPLTIYSNGVFARSDEKNFIDNNASVLNQLLQKMIDLPVMPNIGESVRRIVNDRNCSLAVPKFITRLIFPYAMTRAQFIDKSIEVAIIEIVVIIKKGHYFLPVFNKFNSICFETGYPIKVFKSAMRKGGHDMESTLLPLTFDHLHGIFFVWILVLILSTIIFIIEIISDKVYKKFLMKRKQDRIIRKLRKNLRPSELSYFD